MSPTRWIVAIAAGSLLATLPFWPYLPLGGAVGPHVDHEPRHGGQLGMVGEHHIEVVRHRGRVEVFVSDAMRRPVRPRAGHIVFDGEQETPLTWANHRLSGVDHPAAREIDAHVTLSDGTEIAISFDFS